MALQWISGGKTFAHLDDRASTLFHSLDGSPKASATRAPSADLYHKSETNPRFCPLIRPDPRVIPGYFCKVVLEIHIRLEATGTDDEYKAGPTDDDLEVLHRAAASPRHDLVRQVGGNVGHRACEIPLCNYTTSRQFEP